MADTQTAMVIEAVTHYKKKLLRHVNDEKADVVLHCLSKLDRVPMTIEILQETGVGRIVNQLKKSTDPDSQVADEAKTIVRKWKEIVSNQEEEEERMNADQQVADSRYSNNTQDSRNASSGPDDLAEEEHIPPDDSGSDTGPPTLEPQIESPKKKSSKHSSSKSKNRKKEEEDNKRSNDSNGHKGKDSDRGDENKHIKEKKHSSRPDKTKKEDNGHSESKNKRKSSKSNHEQLKTSRDSSKDKNRRTNLTDKNDISQNSSSHHHREKSHHRSSDSNSINSDSNHKRKEKHKDTKSSRSSHKNKHSEENKGMFENAMLGADDLPKSKKGTRVKDIDDKRNGGISNISFEGIGSRNSNSNRAISVHETNGDRVNGNNLVNLNVPKDINPNYRPAPAHKILNGPSYSSTLTSKSHVDLDGYMGKKKTTMTKVYSGGGRK